MADLKKKKICVLFVIFEFAVFNFKHHLSNYAMVLPFLVKIFLNVSINYSC